MVVALANDVDAKLHDRKILSWPRVAAQTESVYLRLGAGVPPGRDTGPGQSVAVGSP